ncbi:MAG: hypothetical protein BWZ07_02930 [Alphaproteobacteria bacterium ADurb.BinA280]|nr:MAG: hypothetical protein BWZ07_02930 [Alphaproteobacteria bacterium ADurb.BinA280]
MAMSVSLGLGQALACGTHPAQEQAKIDAQELGKLQGLVRDSARDADAVFIGTVSALSQSAAGSKAPGKVTIAVSETLKGEAMAIRHAEWVAAFTYSCQPSAMFHNVGFRPGGRYIVYLRDGSVTRSEAADDLRSGLLPLAQERDLIRDASTHETDS